MTTQQVDAIDTRRGTIELIMIRPSEAVIDVNVRERPDPDPELVNSIAERGVLQPPTCWIDENGIPHITLGQRRTLAAVLAGDDLMPAIAKPRAEAEADRIYEQLTENDRREPIRLKDRLTAYGQLALFGIKADDIAKATGANRAQVRKAVKLTTEHPEIVPVLAEADIDLEQAARIAEYSDHPDLVERLTQVAAKEPKQLPHELEAAKELAAERAAVAEVKAECEEKGWRVVTPEEWDDFCEEHANQGLYELLEVTIDGAAIEDPARAHEQGGLIVAITSRRIWTEPGYPTVYEPEYYVLDPEQHGYSFLDEDDEEALPEISAEEAERIRESKEQAARAAQQKEDWARAANVRREWIRDVLLHDKRKLPKDAGLVILEERLDTTTMLPTRWYSQDAKFAAELLGVKIEGLSESLAHGDDDHREQFLRLAEGLGPTRVSLAVALGRVEGQLSRSVDHRFAGYFELLERWGYPLADIERVAIAYRDERTAVLGAEGAGADG